MNPETLLLELRAAGVTLCPHPDGRMRWRSPAGVMTSERRAALRRHRDDLVDLLRREAAPVASSPLAPGVDAETRALSGATVAQSRPAEGVAETDPIVELLKLAERAGFPRVELLGWGPIPRRQLHLSVSDNYTWPSLSGGFRGAVALLTLRAEGPVRFLFSPSGP